MNVWYMSVLGTCVLVMSVWNECVWDMGLLDKTVRSEYEKYCSWGICLWEKSVWDMSVWYMRVSDMNVLDMRVEYKIM